MHSIGSVLRAGDESKFLERVRERKRHRCTVKHVQVDGPIQRVLNAGYESASYGYTRSPFHIVVTSVATGGLHGSARERDQISHVTSIERQLENSCFLNHLPNPCVPGFYNRRVGLNLDLLAHLTDLQDWIDHRIAVDLQHDSLLDEGSKSRQGGLQPVRSKSQVGQHIRSGLITYCFSNKTGFGLRCSELDTR